MRRVAVIGSGGAGKSVVATQLSERTGLPVTHLDHLFWREGWTPAPREEALRELAAVVARDEWIIDGNFLEAAGTNGDARFERVDTVVFLDLPRATCLRRVLWRLVRDRGRSRADLPEGCSEGFDLPFLRWIWSYPRTDRPRVLQLLSRLDAGVAVHHLRSPAVLRAFFERLEHVVQKENPRLRHRG